MTSRFLTSALSILLLGATMARAQTPPASATPAATPPEKKPKDGYIRFWNMLPKEIGELALQQDTGAGEGTLLAASSMSYYANYVSTKPARYALKLVRTADPKTVLKTFDLVLKTDVFVTFLARMVDGKAKFEMLDDTYDSSKALTGKIVVRQFVPGATVTITSAGLPPGAPLVTGEERTLENLPLRSVIFRLQARMPDGKTRNWSCEIDFATCRHASLWLVQDVHGRFRTRVSADGQMEIIYKER